MQSHKTFIIVLSTVVISLIAGVLIIVFTRNRCIHPDLRVCRALGQFEREQFRHAQGTYSQISPELTLKSDWKLSVPRKQIVLMDQKEETFHMVSTDRDLYVKDYSEEAWWKVPKEEFERYSVNLPFDPEQYLSFLKTRLMEPGVSFTAPRDVACGSSRCVRFVVSPQDRGNDTEYIDIDANNNKITRYIWQSEESERVFVLLYQKQDIALPTHTKTPETGVNVFLESGRSRPSQKKGMELDFVRQFEEERRKREGTPSGGF